MVFPGCISVILVLLVVSSQCIVTLSFPHGGLIKYLYRVVVAIVQNDSSAAGWLTVVIILSYLDEFSKSFKYVNLPHSIDYQ